MRLMLLALLLCSAAAAQKPEYAFYSEYRDFMSSLWVKNQSITPAQVHAAYQSKLKADGIPDHEIARRIKVLETQSAQLEADRWDRYFSNASNEKHFSQKPNGFLMSFAADRRPGVALDYAMGTGRNAIYLAQLGWDVYGFDHSKVAVAEAQKQAVFQKLKLHTAAVSDSEYDFGKERFDLIVFSWSMPLIDTRKVIDSLKPGGTVLMECAVDYVGRNGMLKKFDGLRIERYEIVRGLADWYDRHEVEIIRMIARKQ